MRVMFWVERFWPALGGVETWSQALLPALQARGFEVIIVTTQLEVGQAREGRHGQTPVYRFPFQQALVRRDLRQVKELTEEVIALKREFRPDLNHLNSSCGINLFFFMRSRGVWPRPALLTIHGPTAELNWQGGLGERLLDEADRICAVSAASLDELVGQWPHLAPRSGVIYNGLPPPGVEAAPLDFDAPRLLCLGRLSPEKGFDVAVEAFARLRERFPRARLVIAGVGPQEESLRQQAEALGVDAAVEFAGPVRGEQVAQLINACTVMLVPSRCREGFGLVAIEAAQMARPVVAARLGGLPEVIADGETGLLVEAEDSAALAAAVARLLERPAEAERMGRAARRRAQERFSLEGMADAYARLYREMAGQSAEREEVVCA
jgi:glycosyltransferase involved in cell wall biosynthesis